MSIKKISSITLSPEKVLFAETYEGQVRIHTKDASYNTEYRLYELEEFLPGYFMEFQNQQY